MKKTALMLICALFTISAATFGQEIEKRIQKKVESVAYANSRGAKDPNIKSEAPTVDKKESKARGQFACTIYFENYSGYCAKVYVDGYYKGTMSGYGSLTVRVGSGYTTIYCVSCGGTRVWKDTGGCDSAFEFGLY